MLPPNLFPPRPQHLLLEFMDGCKCPMQHRSGGRCQVSRFYIVRLPTHLPRTATCSQPRNGTCNQSMLRGEGVKEESRKTRHAAMCLPQTTLLYRGHGKLNHTHGARESRSKRSREPRTEN
ncbi:hypothetical protein VTH06DRAFT_8280 [Thermothelomyces fergusii]